MDALWRSDWELAWVPVTCLHDIDESRWPCIQHFWLSWNDSLKDNPKFLKDSYLVLAMIIESASYKFWLDSSTYFLYISFCDFPNGSGEYTCIIRPAWDILKIEKIASGDRICQTLTLPVSISVQHLCLLLLSQQFRWEICIAQGRHSVDYRTH